VDSYLLQNDGKGHFTNVTQQVAPDLKKIGMVTDSQWGDIDGDGDSDLIIAGEWMPITVFENKGGKLVKKEEIDLKNTSGWWHCLLLDDLDGDGDLDFVAGNLGLNSQFKASPQYPMKLWLNDFDNNGTIDPIMATYKNGKAYPIALRHDLLDQLPSLQNKFPTYKSYAGKTVSDIFSSDALANSYRDSVTQLASIVGWNDGSGNFSIQKLPMQAQLTSLYGIGSFDMGQNGHKEILLGGNLYNVDPEFGRYDAGYGTLLEVQKDSLVALPAQKNGLSIDGQIRQIKSLNIAGLGKVILIARNDDSIRFLKVDN